MVKRKSTKTSWLVFGICMCVWTIALLVITFFGLDFIWKFLPAYESGRPNYGIESYMEMLTPEYICNKSEDLIARIDHNVQSEESCRKAIMDAVSDKITYVKILSETTDDKIVYQLRSGATVIGRAEMTTVGEPVYGYSPWQVTFDRFDLSFLVADNVSVTVPSNFQVYVNGNRLSEAYITESDIRYDLPAEYYELFDMPTMVTYEAGPFLTEATLTVSDPDGNPVVIDEDTDMNSFLPSCSDAELAQISELANDYIHDYVAFVSVANSDTSGNFQRLKEHVIPGGELEQRFRAAIDGLYWVSDRHASVGDIDIAYQMEIEEGRYLCDVTYVIETNTFSGPSQAVNHEIMIFVQTEDGLRTEYVRTC